MIGAIAQIDPGIGLNNENLVNGFGPAGAVVIGVLLLVITMMGYAVKALYTRVKEKDEAWANMSQALLQANSAQTSATVQITEKMESVAKILDSISMKIDDVRINKSGCKQQ